MVLKLERPYQARIGSWGSITALIRESHQATWTSWGSKSAPQLPAVLGLFQSSGWEASCIRALVQMRREGGATSNVIGQIGLGRDELMAFCMGDVPPEHPYELQQDPLNCAAKEVLGGGPVTTPQIK